MNLFEKMNEELIQEELLNEIQIDTLLSILTNLDRINLYVNAIKNNEKMKTGPKEVRKNKEILSRSEVDTYLNQNKIYQKAKASDINGNINLILNYYCPE